MDMIAKFMNNFNKTYGILETRSSKEKNAI